MAPWILFGQHEIKNHGVRVHVGRFHTCRVVGGLFIQEHFRGCPDQGDNFELGDLEVQDEHGVVINNFGTTQIRQDSNPLVVFLAVNQNVGRLERE